MSGTGRRRREPSLSRDVTEEPGRCRHRGPRRTRGLDGPCWRRTGLNLTSDQLEFYWRNFVQQDAPEYHFLARGAWPLAPWKGRRQHLRLENVRDHLKGLNAYAPRWTLRAPSRLAVIDLDMGEDELELVGRLGHAPHIVVRSSSSGGLHVMYFLRRKVSGARIRAGLVEALLSAGVPVQDGFVEVWPADKPLRLPLGSGSCLLDPDTLAPIHARYVSYPRHDTRRGRVSTARRVQVDVRASLGWLKDFVRDNRVALRDLVTTRTPRKDPEVSRIRRSRRRARGSRAAVELGRPTDSAAPRAVPSAVGGPLAGEEYYRSLTGLLGGVSQRGRRYDESRRLLFDLYVRQEFSREDTMNEFKRWLLFGRHRSCDLERGQSRTCRRMLRDAGRYIAHLETGLRAGRLYHGGGRVVRPTVSAIVGSERRQPKQALEVSARVDLAELVRVARRQFGDAWRSRMRTYAEPFDVAPVAKSAPWLVSCFAVVLGLLRWANAERGEIDHLVVPVATLKTIAGGRKRGSGERITVLRLRVRTLEGVEIKEMTVPKDGRPYQMLLRELERSGVLRLEVEAIPRVRCRRFSVHLSVESASTRCSENSE